MKKSLYDILEVPATADAEQIEAAFRRQMAAAAADPDTNRAVLVKEAHSILASPRQRTAYDEAHARAAAPAPETAVETPKPAVAPSVPEVDAANEGADDIAEAADPPSVPSRRWLWAAAAVALLLLIVIFWPKSEPPPAATAAAAAPAEEPLPAASTASSPEPSAEEIFARLSGGVARLVVANANGLPLRSGSGVVTAAETIVTDCHVTNDSAQIKARVAGRSYDATISLTDDEFQLCRLYVPGLRATPVTVGSTAEAARGQRVFALSAPRGQELTITEGIVTDLAGTAHGRQLQVSAPFGPGSSGGGIFDADGRLLGIITFQHRFGQNLNYAMPAEWIAAMRDRNPPAPATEPASDSPSPGAG